MARRTAKKLLLKQQQKFYSPFNTDAWARIIETYSLSDMQAHLLSMVLRGEQEDRIAFELGCRPCEVDAHVAELCERVGVSSRDRLVVRMYATLWR